MPSILSNPKILVTGSRGQVGRALHKMSSTVDWDLDFKDRTQLDITSKEEVDELLAKGNYNYVINAAAYTKVDLAEEEEELCRAVNVDGPKHLATATRKNHQILIHISSDYVYHADHDQPMTEETICQPKGVYAQSKWEGDLKVLEINPSTLILRTSWVYYEEGNNFVKTILRLSKEKDSLNIVADQVGSPTNADDVADAIFRMIEYLEQNLDFDSFGVYNFSNGGYISWYDFAKEIVDISGNKCDLSPIPTSEYPTKAARPLNSRMDTNKIVKQFGIDIKPWNQSLRKCINQINKKS